MKKRTLKIKMTLATVLSGKKGETKRKKWHFEKKLPLYSNELKKTRRKLKKLISFMSMLALSATLLTLSGCGRANVYVEPEEIAVVSALGFDVSDNGVSVSLQTARGDGENELKNGEGESVSLALSAICGKGAERYEFSHCALIVLGDGLSSNMISEVFSLCEKSEVSDAVLWVSTHEARELLSLSGSAGYDVAFAIRSHPRGTGLFSENRYFEIVGRKKAESDGGVMALPYFYVSGDEYTPDALKLYCGRSDEIILDRRESALYLIMRGIFSSGTLEASNKAVAIKSCESFFDGQTVICRLEADESLTEAEATAFLSACQGDAEILYRRLLSLHPDPFGFGEASGLLSFRFESKGVA